MLSPQTLSVIIPAWNDASRLGDCLEALLAQKTKPREVILVHTPEGADDGTKNVFDNYRDRFTNVGINVQYLVQPNGIGRARNAGARAASGNILVNLDADCTPIPEYLTRIVRAFETGADAVGGHSTIKERKDYANRFWTGFIQWLRFIAPHKTLVGHSFAIRKDVFDELEGFAEGQPWAEDMDLSYRLWKAEKRVVIDPTAIVYTDGFRRTGDNSLRGQLKALLIGGPWIFMQGAIAYVHIKRGEAQPQVPYFRWQKA